MCTTRPLPCKNPIFFVIPNITITFCLLIYYCPILTDNLVLWGIGGLRRSCYINIPCRSTFYLRFLSKGMINLHRLKLKSFEQKGVWIREKCLELKKCETRQLKIKDKHFSNCINKIKVHKIKIKSELNI